MGSRREAFVFGEWYHCYSRGVDKRRTFESIRDYERFLQALYISNDAAPTNRGNFQHLKHREIFTLPRAKPVVAVGAYCLMPNHFHILIKEIEDGGITSFMRKVGTAYAMYFNTKNTRVGNLFVKPFRSKHVGDDGYFRRVAQYIHLNPVELSEPKWKEGHVRSMRALERKLAEYRFSSLPDYLGIMRSERMILDVETIDLLMDHMPLSDILAEAAAYYAELQP